MHAHLTFCALGCSGEKQRQPHLALANQLKLLLRRYFREG